MKKLVVYKSGTGFTKKYAEWIAKRCDCKAKDLKKVSENELKEQDLVIYGGWVMGNMIMGLNKIRKANPKKLILFAVGCSIDTDDVRNAIKKQSQIENEKFFYYEGGIHYDQLSFPKRMMLKMVRKSLLKKENKTEEDEKMVKLLGTSYDHTDKTYIEPLVSAVNEIKC